MHELQKQKDRCAFIHFKSFLIRVLFFKFSRGDSSRELQPLRFSDVKNKELVVQSAKNRKKRINEWISCAVSKQARQDIL